MAYRYFLILPLAIVMVSCQTIGVYTGDEFYYTENGKFYSCREPAPYKGGNCRLEIDWEDIEKDRNYVDLSR